MMKSIEKTARTVEEAVKEALAELNTTEENVVVEVIEEPTKGLLGIGAKPAVVKVSLKEDKKEKVKDVIENITKCLGLEIKSDIKDAEDSIKVNIEGENLGLLIGHKGETLDALQLLTSVIVNKTGEYKRIELDAQNYREKRQETLVHLAEKKANDVIKYGRNITLEAMTPYERRIIHTALQDNEKVTTISVGNEPFRKVVIKKV